jgi:pimeloyl-ACP methyl ester carboxylesterase
VEGAVIVNGVEVLVEGESAQTLLLVHGWPDSLRLWDATVQALRDRFRCCRFTLPGFAPGSPRREPTLDELVDLFLRVCDAVSPDAPVTLVLHDWGCVFGYQFALRHPERVARIVGVDVGDTGSLQRTLATRHKLAIAAYQLWLALAWKIGGELGDRMTRWMAKSLRAPADPATISARMNWPYHLTWFGGLARQSLPLHPLWPMLFVYGQRKPFMFHTAAWAAALDERPGSRAIGLRTGHWVMVQDPAGFHAALRGWLLDQ